MTLVVPFFRYSAKRFLCYRIITQNWFFFCHCAQSTQKEKFADLRSSSAGSIIVFFLYLFAKFCKTKRKSSNLLWQIKVKLLKKSKLQLILFNSKTNSKIISDLIKLIKRPQKLHGTILLSLTRLNKNIFFWNLGQFFEFVQIIVDNRLLVS